MVPSDSGKVTWWSREGEKVEEFESCVQDYIVRMDWSVSGGGLWVCGFSCLSYLAVERSQTGKEWLGVGVASQCGGMGALALRLWVSCW